MKCALVMQPQLVAAVAAAACLLHIRRAWEEHHSMTSEIGEGSVADLGWSTRAHAARLPWVITPLARRSVGWYARKIQMAYTISFY